MSKNTSEAPKETQKGRHGKSMIILQIDTNSPLLFMDMPEDNLATGHPLTEERLGKEGGVEKKHKKKKHRRHVIEGAEVMLETAKVEMAEQEQERELGVGHEQGEEQARDRKKKKKEKKQHEQKPEDCGVSSEVKWTKEKKNAGEMGQGKEANELETFEQDEHVSQKRRKRTKTSCDPAELRAQCETIAGADDGASKLVERISEQTPREILQERKKKKKKREKSSDRTELTVQGETEDGTEVSQQEEEIPRRKNRKKVEHCSDQAESGVQAEIEDGTESSQQEENILVQTPQEVLQATKKKKKRKDANSDQTESNIQGRVEDGIESSQQEEHVLVQTPQEILQATKKKKKRKDANSDQTESNIHGRVEDGTESSQQEEHVLVQTPQEVLQATKKKKKRKDANSDQTESNIQDEVEDGTGTSQHEEETPNEVLQLTKNKRKKRKEANTDEMESNIQDEVEDGTGISQHKEETPNEVLQLTKNKRKKRKEANTDEMESNNQGRIEDGTESEQHEEIIQNNVLHETKKKRKKREEANTDKMESNIQDEVEDGRGTSQHEEETPNEVLQLTKKKRKKRKEANTDEMESNNQGRIEDGTESEQHEEIIQNNVLHETKKKRKKREEANTDKMESNNQDEVEDGRGTSQHEEETPNEVLQETKKKKKKRKETTSDHQTASNIQGEIEDYSETSKPREEITEQIPQGILQEKKKRRKSNCRQIELSVQSEIENDGEIPLVENRKKRKINNKSDQTESSVQIETMAGVKECAKASRQRGTSKQIPPERTRTRKKKGEGSSGKKRQEILAEVKNSENQAVVFREEPTEHSLEIEKWGDHWEEEKMKYMDELKEFIPGVEKKSTHSVYHLVKYDLLRFREFKKAGVGLKRGRYTVDELARLKKNVEDFLALTGIDSCSKLFFPSRFPDEKAEITKLKSQYKFHLRLSDGICRPWHDIYNKGRKLFDTCKIGRFTDDEINSLLKLQQLHGNKWTKISELTNRSSAALEKRYAQLCKNKGPWSEYELQSLEKAVRDHVVTLAEARDDGPMVRRDQLYSNLPWTEVAQKVGTRSWVQCRSKWMYVLNKRMSAGIEDQHGYDTLLNRIRLIRRLYALGIDDVADINWEDLTKMFGDVTPHFVQTRFHRLKAKLVPQWHTLSFGEIVDFLYEKALPQLEKLQEPESGTGGRSTQQESFLLSEIFGEV
ncbi:transcription termination factor 1-like [Conger conger]|uniref:transcription termination factor 1-like n=1 Tax=Conger conger TaxID=82655 RepID=UPI002A5AD1C0|nr:transcription termination factor 1-like [Conger conger]XP_061117707.1 transcription termination factor 1-like [Conger conger]XP_061117708.1 transcription termination factor 1-like [Conger conger]